MKVLSQLTLASTFFCTSLFSPTVLMLTSDSVFAQARQPTPAQLSNPMRTSERGVEDFANPTTGPSTDDINCNPGSGSKPWTCKCGTEGECLYLHIIGCEHVLEEYYVCDENESD